MMNTFYALEPQWFRFDRFFKVYVTDYDIRGVLIGKQVFDEDSANVQIIAPAQIFAPLLKPWVNRILTRVRLREIEYDSTVLSSDYFLRQDNLNFKIYKHDILQVNIDMRRRFWTGQAKIAGTLRLRMRDRSRREWIITGDQDIDSILACLGHPCSNNPVK